MRSTHNNAVEALSEPSSSLLLANAVRGTHSRCLVLSLGCSESRSAHDGHHVHTKDTNTGIVFDTQVNVLIDTKAKVTSVGKVASSQLVLLDLETTLENLFCLGPTNGDMAGNLFVSSDTESSEGCQVTMREISNSSLLKVILSLLLTVSRLGSDGRLTSQLLQYLGGSGQPVTRLSNGDVDDELVDLELLQERETKSQSSALLSVPLFQHLRSSTLCPDVSASQLDLLPITARSSIPLLSPKPDLSFLFYTSRQCY